MSERDADNHTRLRWAGPCNQCGLCCTQEVTHAGKKARLVCEHLMANLGDVVGDGIRPVGMPMATKCGVYERRVNGMPIKLVDPKTRRPFIVGECHKDDWLEDNRILVNLGRGCSLKLVDGGDVPLNTFIRTGG